MNESYKHMFRNVPRYIWRDLLKSLKHKPRYNMYGKESKEDHDE